MPVSHSIDAAASAPKVTFAPESPVMDCELPLRGHRKRASGSSNNVLAAANSPMKRSISTPVVSSPAMISSEQVADFEKQRQSLVMMTTYITSAIQEKRRVRNTFSHNTATLTLVATIFDLCGQPFPSFILDFLISGLKVN